MQGFFDGFKDIALQYADQRVARGEFLLVVANLLLPLREEDARVVARPQLDVARARDALVGVLQRDVLYAVEEALHPRRGRARPRRREGERRP